ncbi:hypothetical protein BX616_007370 [Lobosporangium transversale]|uniref:Uncharacterized protein n=1 Tax=Lobosporangium transversale TaxID=64571 RepID=A0A1Y2GGE3_9FUNG|nr:hypothetical protein BCR41DRAFT_424374 [Lobosporangium transversale]KAF9914887.1 hypothetical protein BX616_007370 [Lobosporangium transversale]ORZ08796.1 hypothetical protein BCR41DRAFT_424374 [Lobosporangium transversale]|eukprot:XP_021878579.1 hypothetical protein BCR41DRAFT_424374 [Lobosporangium transversale]
MVAKLFNDLVTALDIIPDSSTIDLCVGHPSTCALTGKVRIIAKRPCAYKSLVVTATGISRVWNRQGSRTIKAKQIILDVSKEITYDNPMFTKRPNSLPLPSLASPVEELPSWTNPTAVTATTSSSSSQHVSANVVLSPSVPPQTQRDITRSNSNNESTSPVTFQSSDSFPVGSLPEQQQQRQSPVPSDALSSFQTSLGQNQLNQGVNDIDFRIEFPSHMNINDSSPPNTTTDISQLCHLPSGPMKTTAGGDASIIYTLRVTLIMSRKDILVNNHMSTSVPFRVQSWQDMNESRHQSDDHTYHGKRRNKIEFQFEVPRQLDLRRLQDLQLGFQGSWRTLQDHLKVKEIQYYIVEEEHQRFVGRTSPVVNTTIISTAVTHDCSDYVVSTHAWNQLRAPARLQIPQPNTVLETTLLPAPHSLSVTHKLRVLIKFDQTLAKERDLQLSFPMTIHPTLNLDGSPAHPDPEFYLNNHLTNRHRRPRGGRRRAGGALYGIESRHGDGDGDSEDDDLPLPMYADREETLLLMVGEEVQETGLHVDVLGMAMSYPDQTALYSPSETSPLMTSPNPNSPINATGSYDSRRFSLAGSAPILQGEQHAWATLNRSVSLTPAASAQLVDFASVSAASRRHSSFDYISEYNNNVNNGFYGRSLETFLPPPYVLPSLSEEPSTMTATSITAENLDYEQNSSGGLQGTQSLTEQDSQDLELVQTQAQAQAQAQAQMLEQVQEDGSHHQIYYFEEIPRQEISSVTPPLPLEYEISRSNSFERSSVDEDELEESVGTQVKNYQGKGKDKHIEVPTSPFDTSSITCSSSPSSSSLSSSSYSRTAYGASSSFSGLLTPPYEIREEPLDYLE